MAQSQIPNTVQRILVISFVLIFLSTVIVLLMGHTASTINKDIKQLQAFLDNAENLQPNFEQSLVIYTTNTQPVIDYLLALRPSSEENYIAFIAAIEGIEQKLQIKVNLQSITKSQEAMTTQTDEKTIDYKINFYGNTEMLTAFLKELEALPYYIRVSNVYYLDPSSIVERGASESNITMLVKLYVK